MPRTPCAAARRRKAAPRPRKGLKSTLARCKMLAAASISPRVASHRTGQRLAGYTARASADWYVARGRTNPIAQTTGFAANLRPCRFEAFGRCETVLRNFDPWRRVPQRALAFTRNQNLRSPFNRSRLSAPAAPARVGTRQTACYLESPHELINFPQTNRRQPRQRPPFHRAHHRSAKAAEARRQTARNPLALSRRSESVLRVFRGRRRSVLLAERPYPRALLSPTPPRR